MSHPDPALDQQFPSTAVMAQAARRRMPKFAWDYLTGGIGREEGLDRNRRALDKVTLAPRYITDLGKPDLGATLLGRSFAAPFGVAPIGFGGMMWPQSPEILARAAKALNLPFALSTFSTVDLERIKVLTGENAWFQLYLPHDPEIAEDLIQRAERADYQVLLVTVDIPANTRRPRDIANGLSAPPRLTWRNVWEMAQRPGWVAETIIKGSPEFKNLMPYLPKSIGLADSTRYLLHLVEGHMTPARLKQLRDRWQGRLIVKGILHPEDALACQKIGADALVVSNHGGRQLDAAIAPIDALGPIRQAVGPEMPLIVDSGFRNGLDIARGLAKGADFVLLGRAPAFGVAAMGAPGGDHVLRVLKAELAGTLAQLGCPKISELPKFLTETRHKPA